MHSKQWVTAMETPDSLKPSTESSKPSETQPTVPPLNWLERRDPFLFTSPPSTEPDALFRRYLMTCNPYSPHMVFATVIFSPSLRQARSALRQTISLPALSLSMLTKSFGTSIPLKALRLWSSAIMELPISRLMAGPSKSAPSKTISRSSPSPPDTSTAPSARPSTSPPTSPTPDPAPTALSGPRSSRKVTSVNLSPARCQDLICVVSYTTMNVCYRLV